MLYRRMRPEVSFMANSGSYLLRSRWHSILR
jgi:hypothetical protein